MHVIGILAIEYWVVARLYIIYSQCCSCIIKENSGHVMYICGKLISGSLPMAYYMIINYPTSNRFEMAVLDFKPSLLQK